MTLPDQLRAAVAQHRAGAPLEGGRVARGDVRVVQSPDLHMRRLGLVLSVDDESEHVEIALIHTIPELATSLDRVLLPDGDELTFPLVVQTDLRGLVATVQLGPARARLSEDALRGLNDLDGSLDLDAPVSPARAFRGLPMSGPLDPRWAFKTLEGDEFVALSGDATGAALRDERTWRLDPGLLVLLFERSATDREQLLVDLVALMAEGRLELTADDQLLLLDRGLLEFEAWLEAFGPADAEFLFSCMSDMLLAATSVMDSGESMHSEADWTPARMSFAGPLAAGPTHRLVTSPHLWERDLDDLVLRVGDTIEIEFELLSIMEGAL